MAGKGKPGRPAWIPTEKDIEIAENLAAQGLVDADIAGYFGVHPDTVVEKKKQYSEFSEAIKRGKIKGRAVITNALFQKAKSGDTGALCFWLKNRGGGTWKDKHETEHTGTVNHEHSFNLSGFLDGLSAKIREGATTGEDSTSGEEST